MGWDDGNKNSNWKGPDGNKKQPDLDALVKDFQRRLARLFRGGGSGSGSGSDPSGGKKLKIRPAFIGAVVVILLVIWGLSGFYEVGAASRGIVLRFGSYQATTMPGLRWHLPWPIAQVIKINTDAIETWRYEGSMLTQDENIVDVKLIVQYRRANPVKYLFSVRQPEATLHDITRSAIREVVGKNKLDYILTEGRPEIAKKAKDLLQATLDDYDSGIQIYELNLQDANFPDQVEPAVQDAVKAREDKERTILEAQKYANGQLPRAQGDAARQKQEAEAYRDQVVAQAKGNASRFLQVMAEYKQAPEVTRRRMYLDTVEDVLEHSTKVIVSTDGSNNLLYLPLDKLLERQSDTQAKSDSTPPPVAPSQSSASSVSLRQRTSR